MLGKALPLLQRSQVIRFGITKAQDDFASLVKCEYHVAPAKVAALCPGRDRSSQVKAETRHDMWQRNSR